MNTPLLGFMSEVRSELKDLAQGLLLVAGGYLIGYLAVSIVFWMCEKWVFSQKSPEFLSKIGRHIGGLVLAIIVAVFAFTGKGKPEGEGGDGKGAAVPSSTPGTKSVPTPETPAKLDPTPELKKTTVVKPGNIVIRVTIYGGATVSGDRFYAFEDESQRKSLDELKKVILDRKEAEKGNVTVAILFPTNPNERPGDERVERQLKDWLEKEARLEVVFPVSQK
jgi:hypothetical protein